MNVYENDTKIINCHKMFVQRQGCGAMENGSHVHGELTLTEDMFLAIHYVITVSVLCQY